ncbi:cullin-1-like [Impatiens glandulifera]|uniref:cullin-1-like n=1 Tax=Impatiens glandulifera TaxID=253017 RepID=UPI001FB12026|nr:cullin-1-like [Impatiens glandulifera]
MIKVEECLKREEERVDFYLEKRTEKKLLEAVEYELMSVHAIKLEKKETCQLDAVNSGLLLRASGRGAKETKTSRKFIFCLARNNGYLEYMC